MRITVDSPIKGADAFVFERMSAHEELGRPYRYDLFLLSSNRDLSLSPLLSAVITVHVEIAPGVTRHFGGHVVKAAALGGHGRSARYRVELRPWLSLLRDQATCRIWQNLTVVDALKDVADKAGFSLLIGSDLILAGSEWEYLVQYRESDFNFFMRLVEQEGAHFYFRQEESKHDLLLTDDAMLHDTAFEERRIRFRAEGSSHETTEDIFTHWTVQEQMRTTVYELDDYDFKDSRADLFARSGGPAKLPKNGGKGAEDHDDRPATVFDYPGEYVTLHDANQLTTIRQQELRADRQTVMARGNVRDLGAGSVFTLFDHPRAGQNAKYIVTAMDLTIEAAAVESGLGEGEFVFQGNYALLNSEIPFRLKRTMVKPSIPGLQTALVVGPEKEEIHTDEFGRVRVKFHWDRTGKEEGGKEPKPEERSCWIRVAQPWASSGFGFQFIPRVGDEVVVQFLEGDPDRPLITGSVYNNVNKQPYALPGKKTQSGIKTRSSKQGSADNANEIRFEDDKGHEELFVQAEKNHTVKVKNNRAVSVGGNETYNVTGKRDTEITKKNTDIYKDEHEMHVTKKVVETFDDEHWLHVTKKQTIEVMDNKSEYVDKAYDLTAKGKLLITQGPGPGSGTTMTFEGNAVDMDIKGPLSIVRGPAAIRIDGAGNIALESPLGITLQCGPSKVEITPAGVTVTGIMVKINA